MESKKTDGEMGQELLGQACVISNNAEKINCTMLSKLYSVNSRARVRAMHTLATPMQITKNCVCITTAQGNLAFEEIPIILIIYLQFICYYSELLSSAQEEK